VGGAGGAAGTGGTPDTSTDGGLASQDASRVSDAARADALLGGDAADGSRLSPEAGSPDALADVGDALPSDAAGRPSGDATASDAGNPRGTNGGGCKCDTGRGNDRPGGIAVVALFLGALVLRSLRRRRSRAETR
jgi:hypothetical protein